MSYAAFSGSAVAEKSDTSAITAKIEGNGLITGLPVTVSITQGAPDSGIVFHWTDTDGNVFPIPAGLQSVVNTERGITLAHPAGKTLSIVEHFLCACALTNQMDLVVTVEGAPELPLLDGASEQWVKLLTQHFGPISLPKPALNLKDAVFYRHDENTVIYAVPADNFQVSCSADFNHPGLAGNWIHINPHQEGLDKIAAAQTFGFVRELPILQAKGLAKGVTIDNTLGMTDEGGYTRPLKYDDEPIYHKVLDLMGDLTLTGINPLTVNAHIYAINAGHGSHTAFAKHLLGALACGDA